MIYTMQTEDGNILSFDTLEDAVAAAFKAGAKYDADKCEAIEQGRQSEITLMAQNGDEFVIVAV